MRPIHTLALVLVLSGCHVPVPEDPATQAVVVLRDPARPLKERMAAAVDLIELGPEAKSIEPALLRMLRSRTDLAVSPSDPLIKELFGENAGDAPSHTLRALVSETLTRFVPEPGSVTDLVELFQDDNVLVQSHAALALASLGGGARPAVPALGEALRSDNRDRAETAAFVLARIAPDPAAEAAVPLLSETMRNPEKGWPAQLYAAVALLKLGHEDEEARAMVRDETYLGLILPLLKDKQPLVRLHACEILMLGALPRRDILDRLQDIAAGDPDARVRKASIEAIRKIEAGG